MLINWFTIVAQIINFLVLVFLLQHFLYGPIVRAMDEREARITARLAEAEHQQQMAELEAETYRLENAELAERRKEILDRAEKEAEDHRKDLIDEARREVDEMQRRWYEAIRQEQEEALRDLRHRTGQQVYAVARRALADLADAELERQMVQVFLQRLHDLSEEERLAITAAIQSSERPVLVRTAFELPGDVRQQLRDALQARLGVQPRMRFEMAAGLIAGIELKAHGHKVAWHLADYLESLQEEFARTIETDAQVENEPIRETA